METLTCIPAKPYAVDKRFFVTQCMRNLHEWGGRPLALSHIRVFEAAARLLSFTAAGQECALTQSAVSRHIAEIERQVGQPLFVRRTRALELTPAGSELLAAVQPALARIDECVARLRMPDARYRIDITTFASFASMWLVPRLAQFQAEHPEADIRLSATDRYVDVDREGFTLALRGCDRRHPPPGAIHLFDETVTPMCSPMYAEQAERERRPLRGPADLAHHVLLDLHLEPPRARLVDRWDKWFREIGHPPVRPRGRLIFDMIDQMHQAAVAGQGVALGRRPFSDGLVAAGKLVVPFGEPVPTGYAYFAVMAERAAGEPVAQAFIEWVRATCRAAAPPA